VLDFGCGTGYGTHRLAPGCERIVGVDISAEAVEQACATYQAPNLSYERIEPVERRPLRFEDGSFDLVLSFQVFEHLARPDAYLDEVHRLLSPGGRFICVTPERSPRLFRGQRPWNIFHLREYSQDEMRAWLTTRFTDVEVSGMSARPDLLDMEMRRVRKLRLVTYPFTFPRAPERWRTAGLAWLKRLRREREATVSLDEAPRALADWGFDERDVYLFDDRRPSLNVVAIGTRR
jgi:SAM-dependent methyltransferase